MCLIPSPIKKPILTTNKKAAQTGILETIIASPLTPDHETILVEKVVATIIITANVNKISSLLAFILLSHSQINNHCGNNASNNSNVMSGVLCNKQCSNKPNPNKCKEPHNQRCNCF